MTVPLPPDHPFASLDRLTLLPPEPPAATEEEVRAGTRGAWVAYHSDMSGVNIFSREIDCLRYAIANGTLVKFVEWGEPV